ncbi:MAG TPA: choice-of-anchor D domain-containing protein [Steroidobacteraceae bacterium]|nr:choice-of-anchor D domain-containing protein [Steroidobacteraceae bacterium]
MNTAVNTAGFNETTVWSGQPGGCGNPSSPVVVLNTCYPPAVNYTPLYYLFNGVAFDKTNASKSLFAASPSTATALVTGNVLVRLVNAGLRMHVPSIVGSQTGVAPAGGVVPNGFSLIAEDGNLLPGVPRVQSEVFMAAGKTYDVMINVPSAGSSPALPIYDRELSLSGNAIGRDAGMLAYISINGSALQASAALAGAVANKDSYTAVVPGNTLTVSDPSKGVIANDVNIYGVQVATGPSHGTLTLNGNGTFTYVADSSWTASTPTTTDSFIYCGNGTPYGAANPACNTVTLGAAPIESASGITANNMTFMANVAGYISIDTPGVLAVDSDAAGYPLAVAVSSVKPQSGLNVVMTSNGGFIAMLSTKNTAVGSATFTYQAQNSQGTLSSPATVTVNFPAPSGLQVTIVDGSTSPPVALASPQDYRWIIEEDTTYYVNPNCTANPPPAGCPGNSGNLINGENPNVVPTFGTNFHTSHMPFVAQGCTGPLSCEGGQTVLGVTSACDVGNGTCRPDPTGNGRTPSFPGDVALDPSKRYYLSVLPGDAGTPFQFGYTGAPCPSSAPSSTCAEGHGMSGAPIAAACRPVPPATTCAGTFAPITVVTQPSPYQPAKLSVIVFEDDFPLNGEQDAGGGVDVLAPNEPGLGGFQIHLWDAMGGNGDFTGQMSYDMFNQPLTNSLDGTIDPVTGLNACAISKQGFNKNGTPSGNGGITGMIVTCPKYEGDGKKQILSPLAGQAVIANLMPGRFGVIATPGADRIARGEEWLQTNTLDGQKAHDSFVRIGEPSYFQEYGPAGYHDTIGFANPAIINARLPSVCAGNDAFLPLPGTTCNNTVKGHVTTERMSRTPDERLYGSGTHDSFYWTQCYVSFGDPDGEDFAFTKCDANGNFTLTGLPPGSWRVTVFDQWNDALVDGLSSPVLVPNQPGGMTVDMGEIATNQWQANVYTRTFIDDNQDGVSQSTEAGVPLIPVTVRYRDGSMSNNLATDFNGVANFNEEFPLFNWYVVESDVTRYKNTGTHTVYDAGGPADATSACGKPGYPPCGTANPTSPFNFLANTAETVSVPPALRVPGAVYCKTADCAGRSIQNGAAGLNLSNASDPPSGSCGTSTTAANTCSPQLSTGRIDPPWLGGTEGWQGFSGQNNFIEFGKEPYAPGENGGIKGHIVYASTRPFDDPQMLVQTQWEPLVPHVTINLYQEGIAPDGSKSLSLIDTTQTSSWDDWAQGFRSDGIPNMNCPGQSTSDLFYFTLYNQQNLNNLYNAQHGGPAAPALPNNSQFKCYDGMHNWNQLQPAPYDGMYAFPSVTALDPISGKPAGTNCKVCAPNHAVPKTDLYYGLPMLPAGKYVVEVVVPPGMELVKEEDKNILIGDNFIAPKVQQFGGLGDVFIMPDQASVASAYNANNAGNSTNSLGAVPSNGIVPGFVPEPTWPCVGQSRIVPDYISLFPQTKQVSPFAGATRNLCDRKEVTLGDQMGASAKFYLFTSTHIASKFTGIITDDFTSEFDPFAPQFGEKFSPPNMPIAIKDWTGTEISRVYSDQWGTYNGMVYSTWEVNPPNPTGYAPGMMVYCMNDPGPVNGVTDPLFNPAYSQFCYELPFMPGQTNYLDTPVVPTSAFAGGGYNNPDCAYPAATPAIKEVDGDGIGPWVQKGGNTLTISALGDAVVNNYGYSGPAAITAPFNAKTVTRHYGFGATQGTGTVTIGGITAPVSSWSDALIKVTVPTVLGGKNGVPLCAVQQQATYGGSTAYCGELQITAGNGQSSIDAVTVTIGGKAPKVLPANASATTMTPNGPGAIQQAIDAAQPGDLIIVPPGTYNEMILMWKPVRLQGVGAASSVINANTQPGGKLDPWRHQVNCLFGLALDGTPLSASHPYDASGKVKCGTDAGWTAFSGNFRQPQVDRLPLEGIVGWDTTTNGNLAQLLQEPTLMGAYEGAAITVLSKGVNSHNQAGYYGSGNEASFPTGTTLLTAADCGGTFTSNFQCNPSSIDGLSITDSSQGGGGIFVHAWGHNLQIANDRVYNNIGTLSGGINIGQGESPDGYLAGTTNNTDPGSCENSGIANLQLPYCFNLNVNVHNNYVAQNTSIGDELFSGTPAGAGGVSFCTGADYYKFQYNWVCGNMSTGDGGGFAHIGFIKNGDIEHNQFLFNQSTNPTIATNGGGIIVMGAAPDGFNAQGIECGGTIADADCAPGLPDGTGPGLVINANLLMGNAAESGSGGGLRLQSVNGTEVSNFPGKPNLWNTVTITNNIITNNLAGWDGAGVSLQDALEVSFVNNTVMSNDTTASSGVLFNTLGAPLASAPGANNQTTTTTTSAPQPAGLVTMPNSSNLTATFAGLKITCPANNPNCTAISTPYMANDVFWQNRSYYIGVGSLSAQYQQNVVTLYNSFTNKPAGTQPAAAATTANGKGAVITGGTGACIPGVSYWDIGVRGDNGPGDHHSGYSIAPTYSVLTNATTNGAAPQEAAGASNLYGSNPAVASQYCNGSRTPPEEGGFSGWQVPPGISDATVPNPVFNLTPNATVDEGNNWVNISWGPLAQANPVTGVTLGNYVLTAGSPAIDVIPGNSTAGKAAPPTDYFGNPRPAVKGQAIDVGAVEFQGGGAPAIGSVTGGPLSFGNLTDGTTSAAQTLTLQNSGGSDLTGIALVFSAGFSQAGGTCGTALTAAAGTCTINVVFSPTTPGGVTGSLTITANVPVTGSPVTLTGTGVAAAPNAALTPATFTVSQRRNCPGTGFLGPLLCALDRVETFTLTNTGNVPLTGIAFTLTGTAANLANYALVSLPPVYVNCGATLAVGANCKINYQFKPLTSQAAGAKFVTLSVTDPAGTQTAALNGTAQ